MSEKYDRRLNFSFTERYKDTKSGNAFLNKKLNIDISFILFSLELLVHHFEKWFVVLKLEFRLQN